MNPPKKITEVKEKEARGLEGDGASATASRPVATEFDSIESPPDDGDRLGEATSDSDLDSDSESGMLQYLNQLNGHQKWKGADGTHNDLRDCLVRPEDIQVTFDDVHITSEAIEALDPVLLQLKMPDHFKYGVLAQLPSTGILLYGPPGTGKTQFVRAFAKMANAAVLSLTGADFRHQYVGESEKRIQQIFAYARDHKGSFVIFIDEADSIFRSRSLGNSSTSHVDDINQFLVEMDGVKSTGVQNVMVITASNRPFDIDEGILRRLGRRILVDLPGKDDREAILRIHLKNEELAGDVDLTELARITSDYSGSDLRDLVHEAALTSLREIYSRTKNTAPEGDGCLKSSRAINSGGERRCLHWKHFQAATKKIRPSPKSETVRKVKEFHNKFGNVSRTPAVARLPDQQAFTHIAEVLRNR